MPKMTKMPTLVLIPFWHLSVKVTVSFSGKILSAGTTEEENSRMEITLGKFIKANQLNLERPICVLLKEKLNRMLLNEEDVRHVISEKDFTNYDILDVTVPEIRALDNLESNFGDNLLTTCQNQISKKNNKKNVAGIQKKDLLILDDDKNGEVIYVPYLEGCYEYQNVKYYFVMNSVTGDVHGRRPMEFRNVLIFGIFPILFLYWMCYEWCYGYDTVEYKKKKDTVKQL